MTHMLLYLLLAIGFMLACLPYNFGYMPADS
jgi:hypothetical protein